MFNFYKNFNLKREDEAANPHQSSESRRKKRTLTNRRTQSAIEIDSNQGNDTFASVRSVLLRKEKSENCTDDEPNIETADGGYLQWTSKFDSLAKLFFNRIHTTKGQKEGQEPGRWFSIKDFFAPPFFEKTVFGWFGGQFFI